MIRPDEISEIGKTGKPHGVSGEINIAVDPDSDAYLEDLSCVVLDMDGIFVPFYFDSLRARGESAYLVRFEGVTDDVRAREFSLKKVYALNSELPVPEEPDPDADGFFASDFIGFKVLNPEGELLGEITDIDDSTDNVLFIVRRSDPEEIFYIPVADEFITDIDLAGRTLTMDLPEGLLEI